MALLNLTHADLNAVLEGSIVNEEVLQTIIDVSREKLEFSDRLGSGSVSNKGYSWSMDRLQASLDAAGTPVANAFVDGADSNQNDAATGQRVYNQQQIIGKEVRVSLLGEAANSIGSMGKLSKQVSRRGQEAMRNRESLFLYNQGAVLDDGDTVAGQTAGLEAWIDGKIIVPATYPAESAVVPVTYTQTDARLICTGATGTIDGGGWEDATVPSTGPDAWTYTTVVPAAMNETNLKQVMTALFENTNSRKDRTLMVRPGLNNVIVDFYFSSSARIATLVGETNNEGPATAMGAINAILTNYGKLEIVPNNLQPVSDVADSAPDSESAFFIDWDLVEFANMTGFRVEPLAKTGLSEKRLLTMTSGLRVLSSEGLGMIQGIDPALAMVP